MDDHMNCRLKERAKEKQSKFWEDAKPRLVSVEVALSIQSFASKAP